MAWNIRVSLTGKMPLSSPSMRQLWGLLFQYGMCIFVEMKHLLVGVVLALVLVGCGPKNVVTLKRDAPAAEVATGWYAREEDGYSIVVPESYQVPRDSGMSVGDLQNLSNPAVAYGMTGGQESTTQGAALVLNDKNFKPIPGEPTTGLTVNIFKRGGGADLEAEAKKVGEDMIGEESAKIELPVGPAYELKHKGKMVGGEDVWRVIYVICDGEKLYRLDFTTTNGASVIKDIAPQVAASFRVR